MDMGNGGLTIPIISYNMIDNALLRMIVSCPGISITQSVVRSIHHTHPPGKRFSKRGERAYVSRKRFSARFPPLTRRLNRRWGSSLSRRVGTRSLSFFTYFSSSSLFLARTTRSKNEHDHGLTILRRARCAPIDLVRRCRAQARRLHVPALAASPDTAILGFFRSYVVVPRTTQTNKPP